MLRNLLKFVVTAVGVGLILVAVAALLAAMRLDTLAQAAVVRHVSQAYLTEVTVDGVQVAPLRQTIKIEGLTVFNPPTFKKGPALHFDRVVLGIDAKSLLSDRPTIRQVAIEGGRVNLRYELGKGSNLGRLAKNAAQAAGGAADEGGEVPVQEAPTRVWVDEVVCRGFEVGASSNLVPFVSASMNLARFTLPEVSEGKPVSAPHIASVLLRSVMKEIVTLKGLLRPVGSLLRREIDDLGD